jgi:CheY-like chemotaxis protein
VLPFVFDRFRQGDSGMTRAQTGLGLGLAIVRHIVEMHGGRVTARSAGKNQGAVFTLSLPAASGEQLAAATAAERAGAAADRGHGHRLQGVRALVVDDDPDARELLSTLLEARGVVVRVAGSAREGMRVFEREIPDIIVSDLAMPDQDGYELIRTVRARPEASGGLVPAIAVSAYARPEDSTRAASSGFQVHLAKPIDPNVLYAAVERLAAEHRRRAAE